MPPKDKNKVQGESNTDWAELRHTLLAMQENIQQTIHASIQGLAETMVTHLNRQNPLFDARETDEDDNPFAHGDHERDRDERHRLRPHNPHQQPNNKWEAGFKVEIPEFHGGVKGDSLVDWIVVVEEILDFKDVPDERRVPLVATKFRGHAASWWLQLKATRSRAEKPPIRSWEKLKKHLRRTFLPHNYDRTMYNRLQNLKQGSRSVDDYAEEFYLLLTRNEIRDSNTQLVSRFIGGLRPQLQNSLAQFDPVTVAEAHRRAASFEQQQRSTNWSQTGNRLRLQDQPSDNSPSTLPDGTEASQSSTRPVQQTDDPALRRSSRPNALRCFNCGEPGHRQTACPKQPRRGLLLEEQQEQSAAIYD